jgi:iron-sulfur cluster assembly protein
LGATPKEDFPLLQLTDSAVTALEDARAGQGVPEDHGVRIGTQADDDGQPAIALGFVEAPVEGDQLVEQDGTKVFVAPELIEPLAEMVVDVEDTPQGAQLAIRPQDEENPA